MKTYIYSFTKNSYYLKLALQHEIETIETLQPNGILFPNKWLNVRHTLENDSRNYIDTTDYEITCRRHDIQDKSEMATLSRFLHDLGILLHFQNDPILRPASSSNPTGVTPPSTQSSTTIALKPTSDNSPTPTSPKSGPIAPTPTCTTNSFNS